MSEISYPVGSEFRVEKFSGKFSPIFQTEEEATTYIEANPGWLKVRTPGSKRFVMAVYARKA